MTAELSDCVPHPNRVTNMSSIVVQPRDVTETSDLGTHVERERLQCALSMQSIVRGDLSNVHLFVTSLMNFLTLGIPDPHNKTAFVRHVSVRTTCVLGDLFTIVNGNDEVHSSLTDSTHADNVPTEATESRKNEKSVSMFRLAQYPVCLVLGSTLASRITYGALFAGCFAHPDVVRRVGLPWCTLLFVLLIRAPWASTVLSALVGLLSIETTLGFPLVKRTLA